jgi:hypothetical protein
MRQIQIAVVDITPRVVCTPKPSSVAMTEVTKRTSQSADLTARRRRPADSNGFGETSERLNAARNGLR